MIERNCDISMVLPAFNEVRTIRATLAETTEYFRGRGLSYQIIVAADGNDGTREQARDFALSDPSVQVIGNTARSGKGRGIREGVAMATGDIIGFADADNKVPISEFANLEPWLQNGFEVVIGSRAMAQSLVERRQPWYRRAGSQGFYYFMQAVVGVSGIGDTQCGFKFFQGAVAKDLFSRQRIDGYMFDVEILALAQRLGYRIREVPIRWHDDADSRLRLVSGNLQNMADIFRIRLHCARQDQSLATTQAKTTVG